MVITMNGRGSQPLQPLSNAPGVAKIAFNATQGKAGAQAMICVQKVREVTKAQAVKVSLDQSSTNKFSAS